MPSNKFSFVTNLRPETVKIFKAVGYDTDFWLLSSHRVSNATLTLAHQLRSEGKNLIADNGTKAMIDNVLKTFREKHADLRMQIKQFRRSLPNSRRIPNPRDLPAELRKATSAAAHEVMDEVDHQLALSENDALLSKQLSMQPTHLIAKEDFAVACLIALGYEREISLWPVSYFNRRNARTINYWNEVSNDPRCKDITVFATLSAMDYNTARSAARMAANAGIDSVAIGFAGINRDTSFCDSYLLGRRHRLSGITPRKYLRISNIARGIHDGYAETGFPLKRFHALGMGSRSQLPIMAYLLSPDTSISIDATSPILDSVRDLVFYDINQRGKRATCLNISKMIVAGQDWQFESPFNLDAKNRFGHWPDKARAWWISAGSPAIVPEMLSPHSELGSTIPVFANARGGLTSAQTLSRTGHNHWVMDKITAKIPLENRAQWAEQEMITLVENRKRVIRWGLQAVLEVHQR